jgi:hypothetical protein
MHQHFLWEKGEREKLKVKSFTLVKMIKKYSAGKQK